MNDLFLVEISLVSTKGQVAIIVLLSCGHTIAVTLACALPLFIIEGSRRF